jgi:ornithine cyclodeaminase/alanine dehydrogenase-like protein (mu-crystallin family)
MSHEGNGLRSGGHSAHAVQEPWEGCWLSVVVDGGHVQTGPIWLGAADVEELLDVTAAVESQRQAFVALADGSGQLAARLLLPNDADGSVAFCYAARVSPTTGPVAKFGSVNPGNKSRGMPSVSALVVVLDPETGQPRGVLDGEAVTTARTSAASALAAEVLGRKGPRELAVLGCGTQGRAHVRALVATGNVLRVRMYGPTQSTCREMSAALEEELDVPVQASATAEGAVEGADLVVTATTSTVPVLQAQWLRPGATVLSIGSFAPDRSEVGDDVVAAAGLVVVDHAETALTQSGQLAHAVASGTLAPDGVEGLGDVIIGRAAGRQREDDIVLYTSVGLGIQDAAVATLLLQRAVAQGRGVPIGADRPGHS